MADQTDVERQANAPEAPLQGKGRLARSSTIRVTATQIRERNPAGIFAVLCGTLCCSLLVGIILLILLNIVSFASIVIGAIHLHDCPVEPNIPVMLITLGVIAVFIGIFDTVERSRNRREQQEAGGDPSVKPSGPIFLNSILKFAQFILFIYTCVIVYRSYSDVTYGVTDVNYCHPVAYLFAFWFVTISLFFVVFGFAVFCCVCCCAAVLAAAD